MDKLSPTELEILELLAAGLTIGQIAGRRERSCRTVEKQVATIHDKLDARTLAHAVAIGLRQGIIPL